LKIPRPLYDKIKTIIEEIGFSSVVSGHREGAKNGKGGFVNGSGQVEVSVNHCYLGRVDT